MWFTDAAKSPGPDVTRACVDRFMNAAEPYTADGLPIPVVSGHPATRPTTRRTCLCVARWEDAKGWVGQGDMNATCFDVPQPAYAP
ncbi:hypothetical protein [Streptomyces sp. TP-A0356]|uniref:hypothetical protein n=1 Tax=Streptomyces sp. TP-A0356 TaxID=1359208 RepID=UPI0006E38FC5